MKSKDSTCEMFVVERNTTKNEYGQFTDQIILITKNSQTIMLEPADLRLLEKVVGGKFKI